MDSFYSFIGSIKQEIEEKDVKDEKVVKSTGLNESKSCLRCEAELPGMSKICGECGYRNEGGQDTDMVSVKKTGRPMFDGGKTGREMDQRRGMRRNRNR